MPFVCCFCCKTVILTGGKEFSLARSPSNSSSYLCGPSGSASLFVLYFFYLFVYQCWLDKSWSSLSSISLHCFLRSSSWVIKFSHHWCWPSSILWELDLNFDRTSVIEVASFPSRDGRMRVCVPTGRLGRIMMKASSSFQVLSWAQFL